MKTSMFKSFFNNVTGLQACSFIKRRLQCRCFPVNIADFLRTPILKNICGQFSVNSFMLVDAPFSSILIFQTDHCVKSVHIRSCFGPYFPAFDLNTEI